MSNLTSARPTYYEWLLIIIGMLNWFLPNTLVITWKKTVGNLFFSLFKGLLLPSFLLSCRTRVPCMYHRLLSVLRNMNSERCDSWSLAWMNPAQEYNNSAFNGLREPIVLVPPSVFPKIVVMPMPESFIVHLIPTDQRGTYKLTTSTLVTTVYNSFLTLNKHNLMSLLSVPYLRF
jgi:hypothetical protein